MPPWVASVFEEALTIPVGEAKTYNRGPLRIAVHRLPGVLRFMLAGPGGVEFYRCDLSNSEAERPSATPTGRTL